MIKADLPIIINYSQEMVFVANIKPHEHANIKPDEFLDAFQPMKGFRTHSSFQFCHTPVEDAEVKMLYDLWDFANGNFNVVTDKAGARYFAFEIPLHLYNFLRHIEREDLLKGIAVRLLKSVIHKEQKEFYKKLHKDIKSYIKELVDGEFNEFKNMKYGDFDKYFQFISRVDSFCNSDLGINSSLVFKSPIRLPEFKERTSTNIHCYYLRKDDWDDLIIGEKRVECNGDNAFDELNTWVRLYKYEHGI